MVSKNKDVIIDMKSGVMRDADDGKKAMAANKNISLKVSLATHIAACTSSNSLLSADRTTKAKKLSFSWRAKT